MVYHSLSTLEHDQSTTNLQESSSSSIQPDLDFLEPDYQVVSELGQGGFGAVFDVMDSKHRSFAMKVQKKTENSESELQKEFNIYKALYKHIVSGTETCGIPSVKAYKKHKGLEYMFMERLGDSLQEIKFKSPNKKLNKSDVLKVGIQCVERLRTLHENNILHRDIKPSNLVMGIGPRKEKTVHVIDFGISSIVESWETHDYEEEVSFDGTLHYAPPDALFHKSPSRKGDLISLVYTLLSLYVDLPWVYLNTERERWLTEVELGVQRIQWKAQRLCEGFPELTDFAKAVLRMKRTFEPEYDRLVQLLEKALEELGSQNDGNFTWLEDTPGITYAPSACTEYDSSEKSERYETVSETGMLIEVSEEYVRSQSCAPIIALPWPPPPQREAQAILIDWSASHGPKEPIIAADESLTTKRSPDPRVQGETLNEDFRQQLENQIEVRMSGKSSDGSLDYNLIMVPNTREFPSPGTGTQTCNSSEHLASPQGESPESSSKLHELETAHYDCSLPRSMLRSGAESSDLERRTWKDRTYRPERERNSGSRSREMFFLLVCILILWDSSHGQER